MKVSRQNHIKTSNVLQGNCPAYGTEQLYFDVRSTKDRVRRMRMR